MICRHRRDVLTANALGALIRELGPGNLNGEIEKRAVELAIRTERELARHELAELGPEHFRRVIASLPERPLMPGNEAVVRAIRTSLVRLVECLERGDLDAAVRESEEVDRLFAQGIVVPPANGALS